MSVDHGYSSLCHCEASNGTVPETDVGSTLSLDCEWNDKIRKNNQRKRHFSNYSYTAFVGK